MQREEEFSRLAVVTDVRSGQTLADFESVYAHLKKSRSSTRLVFVDASDEVLARRYSETRRVHPLAQGQGVLEGLRSERRQMASLKELGDLVIDTSQTSVHELKHLIQRTFGSDSDSERPQITFVFFRLQIRPALQRRPGAGCEISAQPLFRS